MSEVFKGSYDPYKEMHAFYGLDDPTADEQFRFAEAMEYLIRTSRDPEDKKAMSYNLAMYYRGIKNFALEKKYLEICAELGDPSGKEQLGFLWYYGPGDEQNYERAFHYFEDCKTRRGLYMMADMYRCGQYVPRDPEKSREIIEDLFAGVLPEKDDPRFYKTTLFPEVALRLVQTDLEDGEATDFDLGCLSDARRILSIRQQTRPFWGNIKLMRKILETTEEMRGSDRSLADLYDLLLFRETNAAVTFDHAGTRHRLDIFENEGETVYQLGQKWFHGAEDFLEKARIDQKRITTLYKQISDISVLYKG